MKVMIVGALIMLVMYFIPNEYMEYKPRKCLVIDKMTTSGGYKSSGKFYLILREGSTGRIFDVISDPATYSQADIGEYITFSLRETDIHQTPRKNAIYFFGYGFLFLLGFCLFVVGILIEGYIFLDKKGFWNY